MAVSKRTRFEVLRRDNHACRYCGRTAPEVKLTLDHVLPVSLGGTDDPDNLVAACHDCNSGKASSSPDEALVAQVSEGAVKWALAQRAAMEEWHRKRAEMSKDVEEFREGWAIWDSTCKYLPADWKSSVESWLTFGFTIDNLIEAMGIAIEGPASSSAVFRYMAGVIRNWQRDIEAGIKPRVGE